MHPGEAVVSQGYLHQVVLGRIGPVDEGHQLGHVARYLQRVGRHVLGLSDADRPRAVSAWGEIALAAQAVHRGGVQAAQQVFAQGCSGLDGRLDLTHGSLDVVDLAQRLGA